VIPRPENPIVAALDVSHLDRAEGLVKALEGEVGMFKIGLELFTAHGPAAVLRVRDHGPVFLDLKLHDIPNTVERAARNCARMGVAMLTVHALGGESMVSAAVRTCAKVCRGWSGTRTCRPRPPEVFTQARTRKCASRSWTSIAALRTSRKAISVGSRSSAMMSGRSSAPTVQPHGWSEMKPRFTR